MHITNFYAEVKIMTRATAPRGGRNHYLKTFYNNVIFFLRAGQKLTSFYKWTRDTVASDPSLKKYF
jgi:hypothetical protein